MAASQSDKKWISQKMRFISKSFRGDDDDDDDDENDDTLSDPLRKN